MTGFAISGRAALGRAFAAVDFEGTDFEGRDLADEVFATGAAGFAVAFMAFAGATFGAALTAALGTGAFRAFADILEPAALGATFAVLFGIALLFLEDATVLPVLRVSSTDSRARLFVALRRAATAFLEVFANFEADDFAADFDEALDFKDLDALFLRVFWATTNRAEPPRPCLMIFRELSAAKLGRIRLRLMELCP